MLALTLISLLPGPLCTPPVLLRWPAPVVSTPTARPAQDSAQEAAQYIAGLFEGEHFERVIKEAEAFLEQHRQHPARPLVRYRLASALFELEEPGRAIPHYRQLAERQGFEYRAEAQLRLGQCELLNERPDRARTALLAALESKQEYLRPTAAFFLGEAEFRLKNYADARKNYERSLRAQEASSYHAHARRGLAWCDFLEQEWASSQKQSKRFLAEFPDHELAPEVRFLLGDAAFQAGSHDAAEKAWSPIEDGEWKEAALRGRAWIRSKRGANRDAAIFFARLLEANPKGRFAQEAALQCGVHLLRDGEKVDALRVLELPTVGRSPEARYWHARALRENDRAEDALKLLDRGGKSPDANNEWVARMQTLRADLLFDLGRLDEAAQGYEQDGSEYGLHAGATASLNAGQSEKALDLAEQFLERYPNSPYRLSTQLVRAEARFSLQDYRGALKDLQALSTAQDLEPQQRSNVLSRLAWCEYLLGDLQSSAETFARVPGNSAEAQEASYMAGRAHSESGNVAAAISGWQDYLQRFPRAERRPEVQLSLSRLTGDPDLLRQLLRENPEHATAPGALVELAELQSHGGQGRRAIESYREHLERFPRNPQTEHVRYSLCWELRSAGDHGAAWAELQPLLNRGTDEEIRLASLELGLWLASDLEQPAQAQALWVPFTSLCKDEHKLLGMGRLVAQLWTRAGEPARASSQLESLAARMKDPQLALDLLLDRAWAHVEGGNIQTALPLVDQAAAQAPGDPRVMELCFFAGEACYEAGEHPRALALYSIAAQPGNEGLVDKALYKLGFTALALKKPGEAQSSFDRLVQEHPRSELTSEGLYLAGESAFRAGDLQAAFDRLQRFHKGVRRHAVRPKVLHRLGLVANQLGQHAVANDALTELLTSAPGVGNRAEARYQQGVALLGLERTRAARSAFQALLKETQNSDTDGLFTARARLELGRLDLQAKDYENALSQFLKVSLLYADGEEVREAKWLSAQVLEAQGEERLAIKNYRELKAAGPDTVQGKRAAQRLKELGA